MTASGFEPTRAEPNGFLVRLLNHSDTLPLANNQYDRLTRTIFYRIVSRTLSYNNIVVFMIESYIANPLLIKQLGEKKVFVKILVAYK